MKKIQFPSLSSLDLIRLDSPPGKDLPSFRIGQVLQGKVMEVVDDRNAVIRMEGRDLSVESRIPLCKGMEGFFEVKGVDPQIILKLLQPEEMSLLDAERWLKAFLMADLSKEDLSERLSLLWKTGTEEMAPAVRETMDRLLSLWSSFSPSRPFAFDPAQVQEMVRRSGLFFEQQMGRLIEDGSQSRFEEALGRDVKGLLAQLKVQLETSSMARTSGPDPSRHEELLEGVNHLLHKIEGYQLLHSSSPAGTQEKIFLLLPFWIHERLQLVDLYLSLSQSGSGRSEPEGMSMLFLLHLPEWGRMSIEVRMSGKKLYGRFLFSSDEVTSFFGGAIDQLRSRLLHLGFHSEMQVSTQAPEKIVESFLNEMKGDDRSLLNLVV
ncbi:MAG: flagellar hook-length control protein FliK [Deltaproteobacteria bacterium]|nr:flagellar hook-length control protein FliK [Deltaproteobacteria bacterium]